MALKTVLTFAATISCWVGWPVVCSADLPMKPARTLEFETTEGTWLSLDVSPDGKTIVFDLLGDLYALDIGGGEAKPITSGLPFDTQPRFSPDGSKILFVSDRSGAENFWTVDPDGGDPQQISFNTDRRMFLSPTWSPDARTVYGSVYRADLVAYELWSFDAAGAAQATLLLPVKTDAAQRREIWASATGAVAAPDGRFIYFARHIGAMDDEVPAWTISRLDLTSGGIDSVVEPSEKRRHDGVAGTYFRPALSPDGNLLVYATRYRGQTGLRLRELKTGTDRWLIFPVQHDQLQATSVQDLLPGYAFTPDGQSLVYSYQGKIWRCALASGAVSEIPFKARVRAELGPDLRQNIVQETGPVRARLIQSPEQSPDGSRLALSALARIYVQDLRPAAKPRLLSDLPPGQFQPSWSPDGHSVVFVTWTARKGGHVWIADADRAAPPRRLTENAAYYTNPVFTPRGDAVLALRSRQTDRMHQSMEYGSVRDASLVRIPLDGGSIRELTQGAMGGRPHFLESGDEVAIDFDDGVHAVALGGGTPRKLLSAPLAEGWYFVEGPGRLQQVKISPDEKWALALSAAEQLHLFPVPEAAGSEEAEPVDLRDPKTPQQQVTRIGADFFGWADGGRSITWALGSTWHRCKLEPLDQPEEGKKPAGVDRGGVFPDRVCRSPETFDVEVEVPRDRPEGDLVLRGATVITMNGDEVIEDADVHVANNRIAAIGPRGSVDLPRGTRIYAVDGKFIVPGFVETHDHIADIRRGILDLESWGPAANLAYGITTALDPSPLSIDMMAYEDLVDAGMMIGSRIHSTGPAIFSFHDFRNLDEVRSVLRRYKEYYRVGNIKMYRTGNRRVREWVAMGAGELGLMPTTEGALAVKLDLTQVLDGYPGLEHELVAQPLGTDVIELMAKSDIEYTPTLIISGGPDSQNFFTIRDDPANDPKIQHFWPGYVIDLKLRDAEWQTFGEYSFPAAAADAAAILRAGGTIGVGAHGNVPGLGYHWEMQALAMGGMTPLEVLRAATTLSARAIGRDSEFGTLEAGKYADLVVLEDDPRKDIANTLSIRQVMKNGRLYDGDTLDEIWPRQRKFPTPWFEQDHPPMTRQ